MTASRPFSDSADLAKLQVFSRKTRWHVADVTWRLMYNHHFDAANNVHLWEDEAGNLIGFTWFYPDAHLEIHTPYAELWPEMLAWGIQRMRAIGKSETLGVSATSAETALIAFLESQGFAFDEAYDARQSLNLTNAIAVPSIPEGFTLRVAPTNNQIEQRVKIHHAAFNSEWVTVEGYRNVMRDPTYDPNLDIFILAPDGRFAAFCLAWADSVTGVGDIEPIGVHPDFQRQGLGRAIMLEALRRLAAKGMNRVVLSTYVKNERALNLYKSLGFEVIYDERAYKKSFPAT